jgi:hypothetical protein
MRKDDLRRLGVVIWSNAGTRSGVIWADDSGRLAYFGDADVEAKVGRTDPPPAAEPPFPAVGDLVSFVEEYRGAVRYARKLHRLGMSGSTELRDLLVAGSRTALDG